MSKTGDSYGDGVLVCLNKKTGAVEWEHKSAYAWSSPVCVYNTDGSGRVIYANSTGHMYLLDGKTGQELNKITLDDSNIEASPAVYDNMLIVGTRGSRIKGIKLE